MTAAGATYEGLVALLRRYLSGASVEAALRVALEQRGLTPRTLGAEELPEVVAEAMIGLRMFCDPARVGDLMVDLSEYCEAAGSDAGTAG